MDTNTEIAFTRMDGGDIDTLSVIRFTHQDDLTSPDEVVAALKRAVTKWVETTEEGADLWNESCEDLNIGDLCCSGHSLSLYARMQAEGIAGWEEVFTLDGGNRVDFDGNRDELGP